MGTSVIIPHVTGASYIRGVVINDAGEYWNISGTPAFEEYDAGNIDDYGIAAAEDGSTGIYRFTFPSGIPLGTYTALGLDAAAASLAETDFPAVAVGEVAWDGTDLLGLSGIGSRLPAALVSDRMSADSVAISGSTAAANKLKASAETIETGAATAITLSTTQMSTNLTEVTDDHYNGRIIIWTSGVLIRQATDITNYNGTTKTLTFTAVTEAPSDANTFIIV